MTMNFRIVDTFIDSLARLNRRGAEGSQDDRVRLATQPAKPRDGLRILSFGRTIALRLAAIKTSD